MNLYSIRFKHYSERDSQEGLLGYVITDSVEKIYEFLKSDPKLSGIQAFTGYEVYEDGKEIFEIYDDNYDFIGEENFKERILRLNGEMYDKDIEIENASYGVTHYGWNLEREIKDESSIPGLIEILGDGIVLL